MTTFGLDIASVDGNKCNFVTARQAGTRFAFLRAIYGRSVIAGSTKPYRDPIWARDQVLVRAAGIKVGAYLFVCYPKAGVTTPSPEEQAQAFIDYVDKSALDLPPVFDVEEESTLSAAEMFDWTKRVALKLRDHYGTWPMMYTSARVWRENVGSHAAGELLECPLWLAKPWPLPVRSPVDFGPQPSSPTTIPQWDGQWTVYQRQGDSLGYPGFTSTVDVDLLNVLKKGDKGGTVRWLQRRLGVTADGDFGPATEAAVKKLQADHKLAADGIVGTDTWTVAFWLMPLS